MCRHERIRATLTASSTTPRSGRKYLDELRNLHEILYTEAKLALAAGDTRTAIELLDQCPPGYGNARRYRAQIATYDALCTNGVLERKETADVRAYLSAVLGEDAGATCVVRYADNLTHHGYNLRSLRALTLRGVHTAMDRAEMSDGHRVLFEADATERTPLLERVLATALRAAERCGVTKRDVVAAVTTVLANAKEEDDGDEEETSE